MGRILTDNNLLPLIYAALGQVNAIRPPDAQVPLEPGVVLAGEDGLLDSFALTTLILALEERVRDRTGQEISLLQEDDLDTLTRNFRTPSAIAAHIADKL